MCCEGDGCSCDSLTESYYELQSIISRVRIYCGAIAKLKVMGMSCYANKEDWEKDNRVVVGQQDMARAILEMIGD
jgi:hypothetical protein